MGVLPACRQVLVQEPLAPLPLPAEPRLGSDKKA